jgi:hypothetical protein
VDIHQVAKLPVGRFLHSTDQTPSSIVDQHIDPTETVDDLGHDLRGALELHDVQDDRMHPARVFRDEVREGVEAAGRGDHDVAPTGDLLRDRTTEARRRSGHQPDPPRRSLVRTIHLTRLLKFGLRRPGVGVCVDLSHAPAPGPIHRVP